MIGKNLPIIAIVIALSVWAVTATATDSDPQAGYVIGPGDVLSIVVYDEPDLERTLTVQNDGFIRFPLIRRYEIGGKTLRDAEAELEEMLGERFLVNPQLTIAIKEFNAKKVYVLGGVKEPGLYSLTGRTTVLEVISKAGGMVGGAGKILLVRGAGSRQDEISKILEKKGDDAGALIEAGITEPVVIDGHKLFDKGDVSQNKELRNGDVIYVPNVKRVYVLGEVRRPGGVPFTDGLTLLQAISLAGGTTEMASNTIYVTRKDEQGKETRIKAKYNKIVKDTSRDIPLEPDDVIVVKRSIF
jgi:polysaccharide biosynthesis/export protein